MNARTVNDYFLQPTEAIHRRYESLRSVFVDGLSLKEVAHRFEVGYGTVRNWVSEFRRELEAGQSPPFFPPRCADAPRLKAGMTATNRKSKSPTRGRCHWKRDAG